MRRSIFFVGVVCMGATGFSPQQWPPVGVDPSGVWKETDSGPLGAAVDNWAMERFRSGLIGEVGGTTHRPGFDGIIDASNKMAREMGPAATTASAQRVLRGLFPDWPKGAPPGAVGLLYWFKILFATPFPEISAKLTALATFSFGHWLMGPLELVDLDREEEEDNVLGDGRGQLLRVKRCRFLEQSACASVCVNACKMPTQSFFLDDMGVPVRMEPNYETLACEFKFGLAPSQQDEEAARATPCFAACPHGGTLKHVDRCPTMDA